MENNLTKHSYDTTVEAEFDGTTARSATNVERRTSSGRNAVRRLDGKRDGTRRLLPESASPSTSATNAWHLWSDDGTTVSTKTMSSYNRRGRFPAHARSPEVSDTGRSAQDEAEPLLCPRWLTHTEPISQNVDLTPGYTGRFPARNRSSRPETVDDGWLTPSQSLQSSNWTSDLFSTYSYILDVN